MLMARLKFQIPDFTRLLWVSAKAKDLWHPRIQRIGSAWAEVEKYSVVDKIREAHLTSTPPSTLPTYVAWAAEQGLVVLPLRRVVTGAQYSQSSQEPGPNDQWAYRTVLLHPNNVPRWNEAWATNDDLTQGEMLGYPACCRAFFQEYWVRGGMVDTTWPMAEQSEGGVDATASSVCRTIVNGSPPESNILLRWLGIRAVPHLPCSFQCEETVQLAKRLSAAGCRRGYCSEMHWIREMLEWPVEWDALHGVAELRTPIVKISTRTDATSIRYIVQRQGTRYPEEGASGSRFPYQVRPEQVQLTRTRSFQAAFAGSKNGHEEGHG